MLADQTNELSVDMFSIMVQCFDVHVLGCKLDTLVMLVELKQVLYDG